MVASFSSQDIALLQSSHSCGVPLQEPPKETEKQDPEVAPSLGGPVYWTVQPPESVQLYRQGLEPRNFKSKETSVELADLLPSTPICSAFTSVEG